MALAGSAHLFWFLIADEETTTLSSTDLDCQRTVDRGARVRANLRYGDFCISVGHNFITYARLKQWCPGLSKVEVVRAKLKDWRTTTLIRPERVEEDRALASNSKGVAQDPHMSDGWCADAKH